MSDKDGESSVAAFEAWLAEDGRGYLTEMSDALSRHPEAILRGRLLMAFRAGLDESRASVKEVDRACLWTRSGDEYDDDGLWNTCGDPWLLPEGTPSTNGMIYCPICGGKLKEGDQ
jgi:hypothetical protein